MIKHQRARNIKFIEVVLKKENINKKALMQLLHEQTPHLTKALLTQETEVISPNPEIKKCVER